MRIDPKPPQKSDQLSCKTYNSGAEYPLDEKVSIEKVKETIHH
jgi:hypothetical protein